MYIKVGSDQLKSDVHIDTIGWKDLQPCESGVTSPVVWHRGRSSFGVDLPAILPVSLA
jgi:hypothetical protein